MSRRSGSLWLLALVLASGAAVALQVSRVGELVPFPTWIEEYDTYQALLRWDLDSPDMEAPYAYRPLTPMAVGLLSRLGLGSPEACQIAWILVMMTAGLAAVGGLARQAGAPWSAALGMVLAVSFAYPFTRSLHIMSGTAGTDPATLLLLCLATSLLLRRRWGWYALVMAVGAANRETQLLLVPAQYFLLAAPGRGRFLDLQAVRSLLWAAPAGLVVVMIRVLLIPVGGSGFWSFYLSQGNLERVLATQGGCFVIIPALLTFGLLWLTTIWASRSWRDPLSRFFWIFLATAGGTLIFAYDTQRMLMVVLPLVVIQTSRLLVTLPVWARWVVIAVISLDGSGVLGPYRLVALILGVLTVVVLRKAAQDLGWSVRSMPEYRVESGRIS